MANAINLTELQGYLGRVPEHRRQRLEWLMALIDRLYPEADISMKYRMPTYSTTAGWIAVANQKHYLSVYTCKPEYLAEFRDRHPAIKGGKGCLNFRDKDELPLADLEKVIRVALEGGG